jgi:gliding motility-associated transport system permease protein
MPNILVIAKRELQSYFVSPIAYVAIAVYLIICGFIFALDMNAMAQYGISPTLQNQFSTMIFLLLLFAPALTMRLLAEEQRMGTLELLLTSPVLDWEVVLGKFLASLGVLLLTIVIAFAYGLMLLAYGNADPGPMAAGYLGLLLSGGALLSIGVLASAMTQNQVVAAVIAIVVNLILWIISAGSQMLSNLTATQALTQLGFFEHTTNFWRGIIDTNDIVYFISLMALALFLATRILETRRWR